MSQINDFKKELKELLFKYSATINISIDGDTHGISDEHLTVTFLQTLKEGQNFRVFSDDYKLNDGYSLNSKELLK